MSFWFRGKVVEEGASRLILILEKKVYFISRVFVLFITLFFCVINLNTLDVHACFVPSVEKDIKKKRE